MTFQQALDYIRENGLQIAQAMMFGSISAKWIGVGLLQLAQTPDDTDIQSDLVTNLSEYIRERVQA
jgi:hypothetical protein